MNEFLYFLSFALGVAATIGIHKFSHSAILAHYEQVYYSNIDGLKERIKALETPAPKGK